MGTRAPSTHGSSVKLTGAVRGTGFFRKAEIGHPEHVHTNALTQMILPNLNKFVRLGSWVGSFYIDKQHILNLVISVSHIAFYVMGIVLRVDSAAINIKENLQWIKRLCII